MELWVTIISALVKEKSNSDPLKVGATRARRFTRSNKNQKIFTKSRQWGNTSHKPAPRERAAGMHVCACRWRATGQVKEVVSPAEGPVMHMPPRFVPRSTCIPWLAEDLGWTGVHRVLFQAGACPARCSGSATPWLACLFGGGGTQCKGLLSQQMASRFAITTTNLRVGKPSLR